MIITLSKIEKCDLLHMKHCCTLDFEPYLINIFMFVKKLSLFIIYQYSSLNDTYF